MTRDPGLQTLLTNHIVRRTPGCPLRRCNSLTWLGLIVFQLPLLGYFMQLCPPRFDEMSTTFCILGRVHSLSSPSSHQYLDRCYGTNSSIAPEVSDSEWFQFNELDSVCKLLSCYWSAKVRFLIAYHQLICCPKPDFVLQLSSNFLSLGSFNHQDLFTHQSPLAGYFFLTLSAVSFIISLSAMSSTLSSHPFVIDLSAA